MLNVGDKVTTKSGKTLKIQELLKAGGQGIAYRVKAKGDRPSVLKLFHPQFQNDDTRSRLKHLVNVKLHSVCPTLFAPTDLVDRSSMLGHVSPNAAGESLEDILAAGGFDLLEAIQIGVALAHSFAKLHDVGINHGDPHSNNVIVHREAGFSQVFLIDFDNFTSKGTPPAPCLGHHLYMAPEIRKHNAAPTPQTDAYGLAVMLHELILLRHLAPVEASEDEFNSIMKEGRWPDDPARKSANQKIKGGYPTDILNANLARMFRAGLSADPKARPSANQWRDALYEALFKVYVCESCGGPNLIDASKNNCPMCSVRYPMLVLEGAFGRIPLERASVVVGRDQLGGSKKVSTSHAVIRRIGPEYRIEDRSANGVSRRTSSGWLRLPRADNLDKQPLIQAGDVLRFADVECKVSVA